MNTEFSLLEKNENFQVQESSNIENNSKKIHNKNDLSFLNQYNLNWNTFKNIRDYSKTIRKIILSQGFSKKLIKKNKSISMNTTEFSNTNINSNSNLVSMSNNSNVCSNQNNFSNQIQNNINFSNNKITKENLITDNFNFDNNSNQIFFSKFENDMKNDIYYQAHLEYEKFMDERTKLLRKINEINIDISNSTERRSVCLDNITKYQSKEICKRLKNLNIKRKHQSNIVLEQDYSFSDDSLDYDLIPLQDNSHKRDYEKNLDDLIEVISKAKIAGDIDSNLRKKKKNMANLRIILEKEFKSLLLTIKYLDINTK